MFLQEDSAPVHTVNNSAAAALHNILGDRKVLRLWWLVSCTSDTFTLYSVGRFKENALGAQQWQFETQILKNSL